MTKPFRIAQPGEFTFKRDGDGVETVETQGLIIGTTDLFHFGPVVHLRPHAADADSNVDEVHKAAHMAQEAGFWKMGCPARDVNGRSMPPVSVTVVVRHA